MFDRLVGLIVGPSPQQLPSVEPMAIERAPAVPTPRPSPVIPLDPDATDNETALARMLASETRSYPAKVVIGWITIKRARQTPLYQFLTKGQGYGAQDRRTDGKGIMYASTAKVPTSEDRRIARDLLSGSLVPSSAIRAHKPGAWVERGQSVSDEALISRQTTWKEGIYAQLAGTKWVLYSSDTKPIQVDQGQTASQALDSLPVVQGIDTSEQKVA